MKPEGISVRQWQELYRAGAFDDKDVIVQRQAGWWDWQCHWDALAGRLKRIAPVVTGIKEPIILDNYSIWFANVRSPGRKAVHDHVQFEPLGDKSNEKIFRVEFGDPNVPDKWALYTNRFSLDAPEYGCARVRDMVQYISTMACELEQGILPSFLDEKRAAVDYVLNRPTIYSSRALRREGEHSYSFLDRDDGYRKTVHVAHSLKDVPPDFQASRTMQIRGLYVYCPEDTEEFLSTPRRAANKSQKRKDVPER
nr:hypothetical protein [uncultured Acetatifactor sp.]